MISALIPMEIILRLSDIQVKIHLGVEKGGVHSFAYHS